MRFWITVAVFALINCCAWVAYHRWCSPNRDLLRVIDALPADDQTLDPYQALVWRFNLPMELTDVQREPPGTIVPDVEGAWEWRDHVTLAFMPKLWPQATRFTATLNPERLRSADGFRLAKPYALTVHTPGLQLFAVDASDIERDQRYVISLQFLDRVPMSELLAHLAIIDNEGRPVACSAFGGDGSTVLRVITEPLIGRTWAAPEHRVRVKISPGLTGIGGPLGMERESLSELVLTDTLHLTRVHADSPDRENHSQVQLEFNRSCDSEALRRVLSVEPAILFTIGGEGSYRTLDGDFNCGVRYTIVVGPPPPGAPKADYPESDRISVIIPDRRPEVWFEHPSGYLGAQGHRAVLAHAVNLRAAKLTVTRLYDSNLVAWRCQGREEVKALGRPLVERTLTIAGETNRTTDLRLALDDLLPPDCRGDGVYELDLAWDEKDATVVRQEHDYYYGWRAHRAESVITLSDFGLSARTAEDGVTVWALSLATAKPVAGTRLRLFSSKCQFIDEARTDADGLARFAKPTLPKDERPAVVIADTPPVEGGAAAGLTWLDLAGSAVRDPLADSGGRPYLRDGCEAFVYADRGVFRPGETAHLRAIVRNGAAGPPPAFPMRWRILRPDLKVWREEMTLLDEEGLAGIDLALPDDLPTGRWTVQTGLPGDDVAFGTTAIQVEDFLPDRMTVAMDFAADALEPEKPGAPRRFPLAAGTLTAQVRGDYLFGQPAAGREAQCWVRLEPGRIQPPGWADWTFGDDANTARETDHITVTGERLDLGRTTLDAQGKATFALPLAEAIARLGGGTVRPWRIIGGASVFEVGGRAVTTSGHVLDLDAVPCYLGFRFDHRPEAGQEARFHVQLVAPDGRAVPGDGAGRTVAVQLYHEVWNTVLHHERGSYRYESARVLEPMGAPLALTLAESRAEGTVAVPSGGAFVLRLRDGSSGQVVSQWFYASDGRGWNDSISREHPERCEVAILPETAGTPTPAEGQATPLTPTEGPATPPTPPLRLGGKALVTVRSPFPGRLLLTVETDRVVSTQVVEMTTNAVTVPLAVTEAWRPNAYVTATVVRPIDANAAWRVHRAYGVVRAPVAQDERHLAVTATAATELRPGATLALDLALADAAGAPAAHAAVTVAVVDEGVLRLTAFRTPDPFAWLIAPRGLGVNAWDCYRDLMPEVARPAGESPTGGDAGASMARYRSPISAKRVRPVALWSGLVHADAAGRVRVELPTPASFNGLLRVMVVATKSANLGAAEAHVTVRGPLVVQTSWPRFAAPGDRFSVPVTVFNRTAADDLAQVTVDPGDGGLITVEPATAVIPVGAGRDATARLVVTVAKRSGVATATVRVVLAKNADATAVEPIELPIRPASPTISMGAEVEVVPGQPRQLDLSTPFLPGSTSIEVWLAPQSALSLPAGLDYLYRYPYGCVEQTVSTCFPLLYLNELSKGPMSDRFSPAGIKRRLATGIDRLACMETEDGGLATWPGERASWPWGSVYAAHFLVEARAAGVVVPDRMLDRLLGFARKLGGRNAEDWLETQAYAAYVLALAGKPDPALMNRLGEELRDEKLAQAAGPSSRFLLSAAWLAAGRRELAASLIPDRLPPPRVQRHLDGDLASPVRDRAIVLSTLLAVEPDHPQILNLVHDLADHRSWMSTQDTAFAMLALGKYLRQSGGGAELYTDARLAIDGVAVASPDGSKERRWTGPTAKTVTTSVTGSERSRGWLSWIASGVPLQPPAEADHGLAVRRIWSRETDWPLAQDAKQRKVKPAGSPEADHPLGDRPLVSGELLRVTVTVTSDSACRNVVVEDLLPAGCEIENPRLETTAATNETGIDRGWRTDMRDDRIILFGNLQHHQNLQNSAGFSSLTHHYLMRVVTPGTFTLPPVRAECMYDLSLNSVSGAGTIEVTERK